MQVIKSLEIQSRILIKEDAPELVNVLCEFNSQLKENKNRISGITLSFHKNKLINIILSYTSVTKENTSLLIIPNNKLDIVLLNCLTENL